MSIQSFSSITGGKQFVIFASDVDQALTTELLQNNNIGFKVLAGSWLDDQLNEIITEPSYIVSWEHIHNDALAGVWMKILGDQKCILHLGPTDSLGRRDAILIFRQALNLKYIGKFTEVTQEDAYANKAGHTYDPSEQRWYVAK